MVLGLFKFKQVVKYLMGTVIVEEHDLQKVKLPWFSAGVIFWHSGSMCIIFTAQNRRPDFIQTFMDKLISWDSVSSRSVTIAHAFVEPQA